MEENFYVYMYSDIDGTPVYVGKGNKKRAWSHLSNSSNPRLKRLLEKRKDEGFDIQPELLAHGSEDAIFQIEIALIQFHGRADLATGPLLNHTDGGEGVSNPSEEVRKKQSDSAFAVYGEKRKFTFENKKENKEFTGTCPEFAKHINLDRISNINRLVLHTTDLHSVQGWTVKGHGYTANEYETVWELEHAMTGEEFSGTQADFVKKYTLSSSLISQMINETILHANGWCKKGKKHLVGELKKNKNGNYYTPLRPWKNSNSTKDSLLAWAMAAEIIKCYQKLVKQKEDVGSIAVRRSMGLLDTLSVRPTDTILDHFRENDWRPEEDEEWLKFHKEYSQKVSLPENNFTGKLIDGRSKGPANKYPEEKINEVFKHLSENKSAKEVAKITGISKSVVHRWIKKYPQKLSIF